MLTPLEWLSFHALLITLLALDLGVFHRRAHEPSMRESLAWLSTWVIVAVLFGYFINVRTGGLQTTEFVTAYIVELTLSVDNVFVFAVVFRYFGIGPDYQHRVLFWGIMGAILMRGLFILGGTALLKFFSPAVYLFGSLLVYSGYRLFRGIESYSDPSKNPLVRRLKDFVPIVDGLEGGKFLVRRNSSLIFTPLAVTLLAVELTDVLFAIDSVPAVLAITRDFSIAYTSNVLAVICLRSLYFVVIKTLRRFAYLDKGLAAILFYLGVKMLLSEVFKIPTFVSLSIVIAILATTIALSLALGKRNYRA